MRLGFFIGAACCGAALAALQVSAAAPDPSTVYAWYQADAGVMTNAAGAVTNWPNKANTGAPAFRDLNLYGVPPSFVPAAVGTNPVVRFSGTNNLFAAAGSFGTLASNRTVVVCVQLNGTNGGFLFDGSTAAGMSRAQVRSNCWEVGLQPAPLANGTKADPPTLGALAAVRQVHFFCFEPLSQGTRVTHSLWNGGSFSYTNSTAIGLGGLILGQNVSQQLGLQVDVGEVLVYDRSLTATEQQEVGAYLADKWQVAAVPSPVVPSPTNVYAWYAGDTSLQVGADGYGVTSWANLGLAATNSTSPQAGRNLVNLTGAPQKLYLRSPGGDALAAVSFGGADGIWSAKSAFGILTNNRTLVVCARVRNGSPQGFLFDSTSTTPGYTRGLVWSNLWHLSLNSGTGTATAPVTTNVWQVHSFVIETNGPTFQHFVDGVLAGSMAAAAPSYLSGLMIGANVSQASGIQADVAEMLVFNSALDAGVRASVEGYLSNKWAGVVADPNAPARPLAYTFTPVFTGGADGYTCYRIPALLATSRGTLIAASDGRIGSCGDIPTPLDLVCKRSFDNGATWGALQVIADYGSNPNDVDTYPFYGVTNVSRVSAGDSSLLLDRTNGRVWVLYDNGGVTNSARKIKLELRYSDDDGTTWSGAIDLEAANPGIRPSYGEFLTGPGTGIQLSAGPHAGRLLFPVYTYGSPSASMVIFSDDHGATWQRGAAVTNGGEVQVAETAGGGLIASLRDNGFAWSGVRTFARSTDGGATWGAAYTNTLNPPTLPDPQCQGNIFRLTTTNDSNASRLLHANAASASSRVAMTLRISYDEGQSWPVSNLVYAGGSAYSSVTKLASGEIGLLFEKDPYGSLSYVRTSVSRVSGGTDSLPPYTVWAGQQFSPLQLSDPAISGPQADPDGDGFDNEAEFLAGTNPLDPASYLRLRLTPPSGATNGLWLNFDAVSNQTYTLQCCDDLQSGTWRRYVDIPALASNTLAQVRADPTNSARFFRLVTPQSP